MGRAVPQRGEPSATALVWAAWTGFGLLRLALWDAAQPLDWRIALLVLSRCWFLAALTPAIVALARALRWTPRRAPLVVGAHLAAALGAALLESGWFVVVRAQLLPHIGLRGYVSRLLLDLDLNAVQYLAVAAWAHAAQHRDLLAARAAASLRAAAAATRARLELLARKLHPHFLFNTLNTVAELLHRDAAAARRTIDDLRALLRVTLGARRTEVTLAEELALLERYLDIQRTRFGARLRVEVVVEDGAHELRVPHLLLQPLVENAVRHGVGRRGEVSILVGARRDRDLLELVVRDHGPGFARAVEEGLGLRNTRERLAALGAGASLEIRGGAGGAEVVARLPARRGSPVEPLAEPDRGALPAPVARRTLVAAIAIAFAGLWLSWIGLRLARVGHTHGPVATGVLVGNTAQLLLVYGAVVALAVAAVRRWPIVRERRLRRLTLHVGLGAAAALALAVARVWINRGVGAPVFSVNFVAGLPYEVGIYAVVAAVTHAALYLGAARARAVEAARLEAEAAESELTARRLRLDAGWLDAELAAIAAEAARDSEAADDRTAALADRLRGLLVEDRA